MRVMLDRGRTRSLLWWGQVILFAAAAAALAWCAFVLADAWLYQRRETAELGRLLQQRRGKPPAAHTPARPPAGVPAAPPRPWIGPHGLIGRMEIPRLGVSVVLAEGTDEGTLRRAVGHIEGTPLPGQPGNVGIAGHRDTFFRPLRNIRRNDIVVLDTLHGQYRYRVVSTRIVTPDAVGVLAPTAEETLTLVTCYPFYFVGSAPDRFIVRAERVSG